MQQVKPVQMNDKQMVFLASKRTVEFFSALRIYLCVCKTIRGFK